MSETRSIKPVQGPVTWLHPSPGIEKHHQPCTDLCSSWPVADPQLTGVLDSDDTRVMLDSLSRLGFSVNHDPSKLAVPRSKGRAGTIPNSRAKLEIGNSGTSVRFLTAMLGLAGGDYFIDGVERMRQRPIGPLVDALKQFGSNVEATSDWLMPSSGHQARREVPATQFQLPETCQANT